MKMRTSSGTSGTASSGTTTQSSTGTQANSSTTTSASSPSGGGAGGAVDELRDGTWKVGEAGEVEFAVRNGALSLGAVRPNSGWQQRVADQKADEIEVHFTRENTKCKFEVELDGGSMKISKEVEIKRAAGGTYQVGNAAEVSFTTDGTRITLGDVRPANGWTVTKQDKSSDDIEIDFRNDTGGTAEFQAELDDGQVKVEIDQKLKGPIPR